MTDLDTRVRKVTWALLGIAISGLVGSVLVSAIVVAQIRNTQVDRQPQTEKNDETLAIIKDCTQPTGDCFKDAQRRTAKAVGDINRVIVIAAACASKPVAQTVPEIAACVTRRLGDPQPLSFVAWNVGQGVRPSPSYGVGAGSCHTRRTARLSHMRQPALHSAGPPLPGHQCRQRSGRQGQGAATQSLVPPRPPTNDRQHL